MKICVVGLWHLGLVAAACTSSRYQTTALDFDEPLVENIKRGKLPIFEPGLSELLFEGIGRGSLHVTSNASEALSSADIVWVTYDTPVNEADEADFEFVRNRIRDLFPFLQPGALLLISSQVPVGFCSQVEAEMTKATRGQNTAVVYSPENLRLGTALKAFLEADRVVIGSRNRADGTRVEELFAPFAASSIHMSVESAEMTKHALNAFLATSVSFMNEIAALCEPTGADAIDVARGLRSDRRIGPSAYLDPGPGFAGGTLGRDVQALAGLARRNGLPSPLLSSISASNEYSRRWPERTLLGLLDPARATIAILGLTYKPGTDTLRRSHAMELASALQKRGAKIRAYDPAVKAFPVGVGAEITLGATIEDALGGADAVVIATPWPDFKNLESETFLQTMRKAIVLDPHRALGENVRRDPRVQYRTVGLPPKGQGGRIR
ncbi:MAG: UDP-glucose dehydrogenase family protein [Candidatus Baltobacteraceae bacterium]